MVPSQCSPVQSGASLVPKAAGAETMETVEPGLETPLPWSLSSASPGAAGPWSVLTLAGLSGPPSAPQLHNPRVFISCCDSLWRK